MKSEKMALRSVLATSALVTVLLLPASSAFQGCARPQQGGVRDARSARASQVVSPLTVSVTRPEQLSSINCLAVARPSFARGAVGAGLTPDSVQPLVQEVADRVLGLKVVGASTATGDSTGYSKSALEAMRRSGTDAVLVTDVQSFKERGGSAIGGDPATVAFTMSIKSTATGEDVWKGQYFYQEEALSENLLKLQDRLGSQGSGAGWSSGRELFERAVETSLSDFGARRESQFLVARP